MITYLGWIIMQTRTFPECCFCLSTASLTFRKTTTWSNLQLCIFVSFDSWLSLSARAPGSQHEDLRYSECNSQKCGWERIVDVWSDSTRHCSKPSACSDPYPWTNTECKMCLVISEHFLATSTHTCNSLWWLHKLNQEWNELNFWREIKVFKTLS